jgi:GNAT superfamily N-acetyltransferase
MALTVQTLQPAHLEEAAELVSRRYRALRREVPALPARYGEIGALLPMLHDLLAAGPGVAAMEGGRLVGFLTAFPIHAFRGEPAVISPEWGNGALMDQSPHIYETMYSQLAPVWVSDGRGTHLVALLANDRQGIEAWRWLGFGMAAVDAIRDLHPVPSPGTGAYIRRAGPDDAGTLLRLEAALIDDLAASPIYLGDAHPSTPDEIKALLADPAYAIWLAFLEDKPVAYLLSGPASENACTIIRDPETSSITGAYTYPDARGAGIATTLLNRALGWAEASGYARCAVDFEATNPSARRFWLRAFTPVSYAFERRIDRRYVARREEI